MYRFDPDNLRTRDILLFVLMLLAPMGYALHGFMRSLDFDGVRSLGIAPDQSLLVQVGNEALRFDASGNSLGRIDYQALANNPYVGNPVFDARGRMLVQAGGVRTDLIGGLRAYLRLRNDASTIAATDQEGMLLCEPNGQRCDAFGEGVLRFDAGWFALFDDTHREWIISDASRHSVYRFNAQGHLLGRMDSGFTFPNHMRIHGEALYVIDTNDKEVEVIGLGEQFGTRLGAHPLFLEEAALLGHTWPYAIERFADRWWVAILDASMDTGSVVAFDDQWRAMGRVELDASLRPSFLKSWQGELLLGDTEGSALLRIAEDTTVLGAFEFEPLVSLLAKHTTARRQWRSDMIFGGVAFFLSMLALLVLGWMNRKETRASESQPVKHNPRLWNRSVGWGRMRSNSVVSSAAMRVWLRY